MRKKVRIGEREINAPLKWSEIDTSSRDTIVIVNGALSILTVRQSQLYLNDQQSILKGFAFQNKEDAEAFIEAMTAMVSGDTQ